METKNKSNKKVLYIVGGIVLFLIIAIVTVILVPPTVAIMLSSSHSKVTSLLKDFNIEEKEFLKDKNSGNIQDKENLEIIVVNLPDLL